MTLTPSNLPSVSHLSKVKIATFSSLSIVKLMFGELLGTDMGSECD